MTRNSIPVERQTSNLMDYLLAAEVVVPIWSAHRSQIVHGWLKHFRETLALTPHPIHGVRTKENNGFTCPAALVAWLATLMVEAPGEINNGRLECIAYCNEIKKCKSSFTGFVFTDEALLPADLASKIALLETLLQS